MRSIWEDQRTSSGLLWRYFKTVHFVSLLEDAKLYFAPVAHFDDRFEGAAAVIPPRFIDPRYAEPDYLDRAFKTSKDDTNVSCWHEAEQESDAMWRLYAEERKGVVICSTSERMSSAILPFRFTSQSQPETLWAGQVRYVDLTQIRLKESGIQRFFYKHVVFAFEREFRLAFNLEMARLFTGQSEVEGVFVPVDLHALIERIILGPRLPEGERDQITQHVRKLGLADRLTDSILLGQPRYY